MDCDQHVHNCKKLFPYTYSLFSENYTLQNTQNAFIIFNDIEIKYFILLNMDALKSLSILHILQIDAPAPARQICDLGAHAMHVQE